MLRVSAIAMEFVAQGHVPKDDVPNTCQPEILDHEICLLQSAAVRHVLAVWSVSRLGEYRPHGGEYVLVCAHRGARMLRETVEVVAKNVDSKAFAWAFVMCELAQVLDWQSQLLAAEGCPEALSPC